MLLILHVFTFKTTFVTMHVNWIIISSIIPSTSEQSVNSSMDTILGSCKTDVKSRFVMVTVSRSGQANYINEY